MVDEVFADTLRTMSGKAPEYVTDSQGRICHAPQPFDEYDDALIHDLIGSKRLAEPVQALLIAYSQINATKGSFGEPDEKRTLAYLLPMLAKLHEACVEEWKDA